MPHFIITTANPRSADGITFDFTKKVVSASRPYATKAAAKSVIARTIRGWTTVVCEFPSSLEAKEYAASVQDLLN